MLRHAGIICLLVIPHSLTLPATLVMFSTSVPVHNGTSLVTSGAIPATVLAHAAESKRNRKCLATLLCGADHGSGAVTDDDVARSLIDGGSHWSTTATEGQGDDASNPGLVAFIKTHVKSKLAVQVNDDWLCFSDAIIARVTMLVNAALCDVEEDATATKAEGGCSAQRPLLRVFLIADNTVSQCCPDEITAKRYGADALVQIGFSCHSKSVSLPVYICEPRLPTSLCPAQLAENVVRLTPALLGAGRPRDAPPQLEPADDPSKTRSIHSSTVVVLHGANSAAFALKLTDRVSQAVLERGDPASRAMLSSESNPAAQFITPEGDVVLAICHVCSTDGSETATTSARRAADQSLPSEWIVGGGVTFPVRKGSPQSILYVAPTFIVAAAATAPSDRRDATITSFPPLLHELIFIAMHNEWNGGLKVAEGGLSLYGHLAAVRPSSSSVSSPTAGASDSLEDSTGGGQPVRVSAADMASGAATAIHARYRQRMFNVEAVKKASAVGIVVSGAGLRDARPLAESLRTLLIRSGRRAYVIYVGCINPQKLANFADSLDCFVVIACAASQVANFGKKSDGFMKPLVSPVEALLALDAIDWSDPASFATRGDLVLRAAERACRLAVDSTDGAPATGGQLVAQRPLNVAVVQMGGSSALQRLAERQWTGLDPAVGATPIQREIVEGRSGIARGYEREQGPLAVAS